MIGFERNAAVDTTWRGEWIAYLVTLAADHRLDEDEAIEVARDLTRPLVRRPYKLG
jgi:hypothetical protein